MFDSDLDLFGLRLRTLSDDLLRFGSPGFLQSLDPGVTISNWVLSPDMGIKLCGEVKGHPNLRDGPIETSQLFFIDQKLCLARTLSRWYRLGAPLDPGLNRTRQ